MTSATAVNVAIGLVAIYLLYSLFVSLLGEMVATWLGLRARILRRTLERMLNGDPTSQFKNVLADYFLYEHRDFRYTVAGRFYQFGLKSFANQRGPRWLLFQSTKPSYLTASRFSEILIHLLRRRALGKDDSTKISYSLQYNTLHFHAQTQRYIRDLFDDAGGSVLEFRRRLEDWFNETSERATGWYKRKIQVILFFLGFAVALSFNVDTIGIVNRLTVEPAARQELEQLVNLMVDSTRTRIQQRHHHPDSVRSNEEVVNSWREVFRTLAPVNQAIALGWDGIAPRKITMIGIQFSWYDQLNPFRIEFWGLVITALALSFGAPFWFDLLVKLVAIRGTGTRPLGKGVTGEPVQRTQTPPITITTQEQGPSFSEHVDPPGVIQQETESLVKLLGNDPDILSIHPGFRETEEGKVEAVEIHVRNPEARDRLERVLVDAFHGQRPVILVKTEARVHGADYGEKIHNRMAVNGIGTLGCFVEDIDGYVHLVSCWHVLKDDRRWNGPVGNRQIRDAYGTIANLVEGVLSSKLDVGFAEITVDFRNGGGIRNSYRPVTKQDALRSTRVSFLGAASGRAEGFVYNHAVDVTLDYPDQYRKLEDLFSITTKVGGRYLAPSMEGDSGALVLDLAGCPIGIIVGGDDSFTYVMKLTNIIGPGAPYEDYALITS